MDAQRLEELVSRWVSGDRLAPAEEQHLLQWLKNHPEDRGELLADEELDSLLRCLPRVEDTAAGFVQDCLRRLAARPLDQRSRAAAAAVPAIVAPPVVTPRSATPGRDVRRSRGFFVGGAGRWAAAVACCSAALLLGAIGWRLLARGPGAVEANRSAAPVHGLPAPSLAARKDSRPPEPDHAFATLSQSATAAWDSPRAEGSRLSAGILKLTAGAAELHFDKGTVARLSGPAVLELRSGNEVFLQHGNVTARVPPPAVGFAVVTPLSRIVDLGTEFDVAVDGAGATQTMVRKGRISLTPQRGQEEPATPIELVAGALDRATVSVPDMAASTLPVTTVASGLQGQFLGLMSSNGKTVGFHSPEAFREFQTRALKQLHEAPSEFGRRWSGLVAAFDRGADAPPRVGPALRHDVPAAQAPRPGVATGVAAAHGNVAAAPSGRAVEVHENGKTISITDSKESGITVTVTESDGGRKRTTEVRAANAAELARKNPDAHRMYRQYYHPRPKTGKR
jgi:hypothetical protein